MIRANPRISLCMIVRDESHQLDACLRDVRKLVDEVVIVDTGSRDATVQEAQRLGARVHHFPWCDDFSAARNCALGHATGDWILWLDADDRLDAQALATLGQLLRKLNDISVSYVMTTRCSPLPGSEVANLLSHVRLFPKHPLVAWEGRVHEQLAPSLGRAGINTLSTEVVIEHIGYRDASLTQRKAARDKRLLLIEYALNPQDPRVLLHLGLACMRQGEREEAVRYFRECLPYADGKGDWQRKVFGVLAIALSELGQFEESVAVARQGLGLFPYDPELTRLVAEYGLEFHHLAEAERLLVDALRSPAKLLMLSGEFEHLATVELRRTLARVYIEQGRAAEAEALLHSVLRDTPRSTITWTTLAFLHLRTGAQAKCAETLAPLEQCPGGDVLSLSIRAQLAHLRGEGATAYRLANEAAAQAPENLYVQYSRAEILGDLTIPRAEQQAAWGHVLRLNPADANARRRYAELAGPAAPAPAPDIASPLAWGATTTVVGMSSDSPRA